ncbi:PTS sugar transporter subunit IIA [Thiovibrio sp. JS02]
MNQTNRKIGYIIVTHGEIGAALLSVARYILDKPLEHFTSVHVPFMSELPHLRENGCKTPFATRQQLIREKILAAKKQVDGGGGVIVLTDVVGGTSFSVARELLGPEEGVLIAGVNLPMVLKAGELKDRSLAEAATELVERSRKAIIKRTPGAGG